MNNLMLLVVTFPSPSVDTETLKIWRRRRASVVLPEEEGPERPMIMVLDGSEPDCGLLGMMAVGRRWGDNMSISDVRWYAVLDLRDVFEFGSSEVVERKEMYLAVYFQYSTCLCFDCPLWHVLCWSRSSDDKFPPPARWILIVRLHEACYVPAVIRFSSEFASGTLLGRCLRDLLAISLRSRVVTRRYSLLVWMYRIYSLADTFWARLACNTRLPVGGNGF